MMYLESGTYQIMQEILHGKTGKFQHGGVSQCFCLLEPFSFLISFSFFGVEGGSSNAGEGGYRYGGRVYLVQGDSLYILRG